MTSTISPEAVAAGTRALMHRTYIERNPDPMTFTDVARLVLEAAAPHMAPAPPARCASHSPNFGVQCALVEHDATVVHQSSKGDSLFAWSNWNTRAGGEQHG